MHASSQSGAVNRKLIICLSIPVVLVALVFGWFFLTRYKLERERTDWKTATLPKLASVSITNTDKGIVVQLEQSVLQGPDDQHAWIGEHVLLMKNHEYLVFAFHHGLNNGLVDHLFLAHGSDGHWYYSTYHFCNEMVSLIMEEQPRSIAEFASRYSVREFDGKSDVCLEHTWPPHK
jgi:hypothetical protein